MTTAATFDPVVVAQELGLTLVMEEAQRLVAFIQSAYQRGLNDAGPMTSDVLRVELEACAEICDHYAYALDYGGNRYVRSRECLQAAAAIRAKAKP